MLIVTLSVVLALIPGPYLSAQQTVLGAESEGYSAGKLNKQLPYALPEILKATVQGLHDLHLPIVQHTGDHLTAYVDSLLSDDRPVWISLQALTTTHTLLGIRVGINGDEKQSRRVLEAVKLQLPRA